MTLRVTIAVQQARCAHCGRIIGYRTCSPQARHLVTHGMCLPMCPEARAAGWGEYEAPMLATRPWLRRDNEPTKEAA